MNGNKTIACMGELLIDMIQGDEDMTFKAHPGGAPANVAVGVARLGGKSAFMGKVGDDNFGNFLEDTLKRDNVNTRGLKRGGQTAIALVSLDKAGDRSFRFYEDLVQYTEGDIDLKLLDESGVFHFGSISLIYDAARQATVKCLQYAREKGLLISYDPNYRDKLWDEDSARKGIKVGLVYADVLKVSDEEMKLLTGETDNEKGVEKLLGMAPNLKVIAVTWGKDGSYCYYRGRGKAIPTMEIKAVDTTGAGDGFTAGLLYSITQAGGLDNIDWNRMEEAFRLANTAGTLTSTKKGAITALPTMEEVKRYL